MRAFKTILAYLVSLVLIAAVALAAILVFANPHGGILPLWLHLPFLLIAWLSVFIFPAWIARTVWRKSKPST